MNRWIRVFLILTPAMGGTPTSPSPTSSSIGVLVTISGGIIQSMVLPIWSIGITRGRRMFNLSSICICGMHWRGYKGRSNIRIMRGGGIHSHLAWGFYRQTTVLFLPVKHQIIPIVRDITCILLLFFCTLLPFSIGFSDWPKGKGTQM